jgi:hypothetical protein
VCKPRTGETSAANRRETSAADETSATEIYTAAHATEMRATAAKVGAAAALHPASHAAAEAAGMPAASHATAHAAAAHASGVPATSRAAAEAAATTAALCKRWRCKGKYRAKRTGDEAPNNFVVHLDSSVVETWRRIPSRQENNQRTQLIQ